MRSETPVENFRRAGEQKYRLLGGTDNVMVGDKGVEPLTSSTSMRRSSQLS